MAASAPGTTRAVKSVVGAAAPSHHPELEAGATAAFAELWAADAHWAAVEAVETQTESELSRGPLTFSRAGVTTERTKLNSKSPK
jgi:hypothetical protein